MNKQWLVVVGIVAAMGAGTWRLVKSAPPHIQIGAKAPDFTATDLATGKTVTLYDRYKGEVTLVNIWATWCDPCKDEIPALDSLYQRLRDKGFHIAAVSIDEGNDEVVRKFAKEYHISFDVLHDQSGVIQQIYQTTGVPESFLIDKHGRIQRMIPRGHPWASAESQRVVEELLAQPSD